MSAPKGNQNAQKGTQAATSWLQIRVTPQDKARWVKAAQESGAANLTEWVTRNLNATPKLIAAVAGLIGCHDSGFEICTCTACQNARAAITSMLPSAEYPEPRITTEGKV